MRLSARPDAHSPRRYASNIVARGQHRVLGCSLRNPERPSRKQSFLVFADLSPYGVMEILDLLISDAQQEQFLRAYDVTRLVLERLAILPSTPQEKQKLLELDELEIGYGVICRQDAAQRHGRSSERPFLLGG